MKRLLSLPLLLIIFVNASAQDRKKAMELFETGNFEEAIDEYLHLYEEDKESLEYNYNLAVSYLNTNIDKSRQMPLRVLAGCPVPTGAFQQTNQISSGQENACEDMLSEDQIRGCGEQFLLLVDRRAKARTDGVLSS